MSSRGAARVTTADGYLPVGETPQNLTIRAESPVDRLHIDGSVARGVSLVGGERISAGRIVLSAGTYGSPAILLRSGIGPGEHLRDLGIPIVVDLPGVGANLVDHPAVSVECGYTGTGRNAPVLHAIATFHSADRASVESPDLMLWLSDPPGAAGEPATFEIDVVLLRPRSTGRVTLRSTDPTAAPSIVLPSLTEATDLARLCEGYQRAVEVANRPELRRLCSSPAPAALSDGELATHVRAEAYSIPHVVGTCRMGRNPQEGAVVDARGDVHGTEQLSVVDASIMPDVPSGFTHVPTIMIAERLSDELASRL